MTEETGKKGFPIVIWIAIALWIIGGLAVCSYSNSLPRSGLKPQPEEEYEPTNSGNYFQ